MKNYIRVKKRLLKDPRIKRAYEALGSEFKVADALDARIKISVNAK